MLVGVPRGADFLCQGEEEKLQRRGSSTCYQAAVAQAQPEPLAGFMETDHDSNIKWSSPNWRQLNVLELETLNELWYAHRGGLCFH